MVPGPKSAIRYDIHENGAVRMPGSHYLAGSSVSLDQALRNVMDWYGFSLAESLRMTRYNPLNALSISKTIPAIDCAAEFVEWCIEDTGPHVVRAHIGPWTIEPSTP